jgi:hypothetical protein
MEYLFESAIFSCLSFAGLWIANTITSTGIELEDILYLAIPTSIIFPFSSLLADILFFLILYYKLDTGFSLLVFMGSKGSYMDYIIFLALGVGFPEFITKKILEL